MLTTIAGTIAAALFAGIIKWFLGKGKVTVDPQILKEERDEAEDMLSTNRPSDDDLINGLREPKR